MPEIAESLPTPAAASFASLLASHAARPPRITEWNDDELADDVATLSYEQAVRTHSRFRREDFPVLSEDEIETSGKAIAAAMKSALKTKPAQPIAQNSEPAVPAQVTHSRLLSLEENRKSASITIRLSQTECDQLRERAAAAGMTVSAYLRSCTFEVEALRAQVKDTLVKLRSGVPLDEPKLAENPTAASRQPETARPKPPASETPSGWAMLRARLFPQRSAIRRTAQA